jgi:hypothetical protein
MVGNQSMQKTSSANLIVVFNELEKLSLTPELEKIQAHIKAAQVQVNEIHHPALSYSTVSTRSRHSRHNRGSQHQGSERPRHQASGPYLYLGPKGNYEAYPDRGRRPPRLPID